MNIKTTLQKTFRVLRKRLRLPRTLSVTQNGWKFLGLTMIVGFAAVNTANNLLYLVFGLMLSFITASGVLSELMLRKVSLVRTFPRHIFAQQPAPVVVTLTNRKKYLSSFSLVIEDFSQGNPSGNSAYILKIPARQATTVTYSVTFTRRGIHLPGKMRLSTRYPFGFFLSQPHLSKSMMRFLSIPKFRTSSLRIFQIRLHMPGNLTH